MYTLHHYFLCPASRFVRIILEEKKVKFNLQIENYWDPQKSYLLMNPAGYFPILKHTNNSPIVGASVIMEYLENVYESNFPKPFNIPKSIKFINVDIATGKPSNENFITESFKNNFNFESKYDINKDSSDEFQFKGFY